MSTSAIRVENLGKQYRIGSLQGGYKTLRETLMDSMVLPFRRAGKLLRGEATGAAGLDESFWALKDVSFDVEQGEVVGIIGRNGAGKSTLLKLLARITEPTAGFAEIRGRVGSLLEVGTGFHPELTGRENVYLNGAILGMLRSEIGRKFDEIVAFAEVEKFIDTPVKHYSSGMYLRLAFSVAAHLEPEILLIDEVLAVGDPFFQKKCLGKMGDVASEGRTILFVSHNMSAIRSLCHRAVLIENGQIRHDGDVSSALRQYHGLVQSGEIKARPGKVAFSKFRLNGQEKMVVKSDEDLEFAFTMNVKITAKYAKLWCVIQDPEDNYMLHHRIESTELFDELVPGTYQLKIRMPALWLRAGAYTIHVMLKANVKTGGRYLSDRLIIEFEPSEDALDDLAALKGQLTPPVSWSVESYAHDVSEIA